MESTTTFLPDNRVKLFLCLPVKSLEQRTDSSISFTVSAGNTFPDLGSIMNEKKRVVTFDDSSISGYCNGTGCTSTTTPVCEGIACKGYSSTTDSIWYTMYPLYPPTYTFLAELKPKIGLIRYEKAAPATTFPFFLSSPPPAGDFAIFSITYSDANLFSTLDKYSALFQTVMDTIGNFKLVKNGKNFSQHNMGKLQELQRHFKIDTTQVKDQVKNVRGLMASQPPNTRRPNRQLGGSLSPSVSRPPKRTSGSLPPMSGQPQQNKQQQGSLPPSKEKFRLNYGTLEDAYY